MHLVVGKCLVLKFVKWDDDVAIIHEPLCMHDDGIIVDDVMLLVNDGHSW